MPPCTSTRLCCSFSRVSRRNFGRAEDFVARQQAPAADAEFGIALGRAHAVDQLDAGPHAAGILPAAAGAAQPLAQDGARRHQAPVVLFQAAGERVDLAGGAHASRDQAASRLVETARREPLGISFTWLTISMPWPGAPVRRASRSASGCGGAFHARRHDAGGDHGGLEQAQVVAREIEDFGDGGDLRRWPSDPRWPGAAPAGRSRGNRLPRAAWAPRGRSRRARQVDGDVEHARAFGEIHAEEENVAPAAVGEVHAHGRGFAQDGKQRIAAGAPAVRAGCAADNRPGGRCGTSTGCRARSARCGAPGRPGSGNPARGSRRPARWRWRRSGRRRPAPPGKYRWPPRIAASAGWRSRRRG